MTKDHTLASVRDMLYKCMEALYLDDKDDQIAKDIAGAIVMIHDAIEIELLERMVSR